MIQNLFLSFSSPSPLDMTGGLSQSGHKLRGYPGYELTNSVRVPPQPPITYVSIGGEPNSSVRIAELAELMISRTLCCMNGARLAPFSLFQHQVASACPSKT